MPTKKAAKTTPKVDTPPESAPAYARVVSALTKEPLVTYGGKGFDSTGLKVGGKLVATLSSKGKFVVKLPKDPVDDLVKTRKGRYFDPGHGRLMKEWLEVAP